MLKALATSFILMTLLGYFEATSHNVIARKILTGFAVICFWIFSILVIILLIRLGQYVVANLVAH